MRTIIVFFICMILSSARAEAEQRSFASLDTSKLSPDRLKLLYAVVGKSTTAPKGWIEFCKDNKEECPTGMTEPSDITLTPKGWDKLIKVNRQVNESIKTRSDMEHWGVEEKWSIPTDGYGDSEDYALLKRKMLIDAGFPQQALLMTIVRILLTDGTRPGLAVLTAKTDKGEFVLASDIHNDVMLWSDTKFLFVKRQSQSDPNVWVKLGPEETPK